MRRRTATLACALTAALALLGAVADAQVTEVGMYSDAPFTTPGCPAHCSAIGQVTGYQVQSGRRRNPFVVHQSGRIVALTVDLGAPTQRQYDFFTKTFGGPPRARVAVLRPLSHNRGLQLIAISETIDLQPYLGSTPTFPLATSLPAPAGSVVALTVPTWAPAFTVTVGSDQRWRSSRADCGNPRLAAVQDKAGSTRSYKCLYKNARLLYSATLVPNPKPTAKPKNSSHAGR